MGESLCKTLCSPPVNLPWSQWFRHSLFPFTGRCLRFKERELLVTQLVRVVVGIQTLVCLYFRGILSLPLAVMPK